MKRTREQFIRETGVPRGILKEAVRLADIQNCRPMMEETQVKLCGLCLELMHAAEAAAPAARLSAAIRQTETLMRTAKREIRTDGLSVLDVMDWLGRGKPEISGDLLKI